jgi:hypothetical protein
MAGTILGHLLNLQTAHDLRLVEIKKAKEIERTDIHSPHKSAPR